MVSECSTVLLVAVKTAVNWWQTSAYLYSGATTGNSSGLFSIDDLVRAPMPT
jgi:hypothetical protein